MSHQEKLLKLALEAGLIDWFDFFERLRKVDAVGKSVDLTGQRYGRLEVVSLAEVSGGKKRWLCKCDCGGEKRVEAARLNWGATKSCGCLQREGTASRFRKHGHALTPEYKIWRAMKTRCYNPRSNNFIRWGGRGIYVCDRWKDSFENFLADMGRRPAGDYSIDRIDNDGPYSPDNCHWATRSQQNSNTCRSVKFRKIGAR